jgi:hypothetical protein
MAKRPEHLAPPEIVSNINYQLRKLVYHLQLYFQFYNEDEAKKYSQKYEINVHQISKVKLIIISLQHTNN